MYYVTGPTSDYSIHKKLESVNQHVVTSEDSDFVLNATTGKSDQIGSGSQMKCHEHAFNNPVMCTTEEPLMPESSKSKPSRKKCKKLTMVSIK